MPTVDPVPNEPLAALQSQVFGKLGRCVVQLQRYELLMKHLLTRQRVVGPARSIADRQPQRTGGFAQRTLGQLVGEFSSVFDEPDWDAVLPWDERAEAWVGFGFRLEVPAEDREALTTELTTLVALRNDLVHGFVGAHDLSTVDGCEVALAYLDEARAEVDAQLDQLWTLQDQMTEVSRHLGKILADPQVLDHLFHGILPGGVGFDWEASTLVGLLRQAETELAQDGWTPLDAAVELLRAIAPEHTPSRYGCSSWRQVLHEARPLFTIRRETGGPSVLGKTWYQSARRR